MTVAGIGFAVVVPGCGSGGPGKPPPPTSGAEGGATPDTAFSGVGSARFCDLLRSFDATSKKAPTLSDPAALRDAFRSAESSVKQAAAAAPSEIKGDVTLLSGLYADLLAALETANFDFAELSPASIASFSSQGLNDASARVEAYTRNICKVDRKR